MKLQLIYTKSDGKTSQIKIDDWDAPPPFIGDLIIVDGEEQIVFDRDIIVDVGTGTMVALYQARFSQIKKP